MKFEYKDLLEKKLIIVKEYPDGKKILKYSKRVFWDSLWHVDERLLECRGLVLDKDDNIIVRPFKRVFNYGENGTTVDTEAVVIAIPKVNGFLGCATKMRDGEIIYSTTGSLDSDYVWMIKAMMPEGIASKLMWGVTHMFEICHTDDPHIVQEGVGAYLIGIREIECGTLMNEVCLDVMAVALGVERREAFHTTFKDLQEYLKVCGGEGYMVRGLDGAVLCKLKSPHYLTKKFLMRMSKGKVAEMYDSPQKYKQSVDEEFYGIVDFITTKIDKDVWIGYSDQQRRQLIEEYYRDGHYYG